MLTEQEITSLLASASDDVAKSKDLDALEDCRRKYLGRKSELQQQFKLLRDESDPEVKRAHATHLNKARAALEEQIQERKETLSANSETGDNDIDISLPPRSRYVGGLHPITMVMRRIEDILLGSGYELREGPEIEDEMFNFDALNIEPHHPAREMHDTMYIQPNYGENKLLRSHTSPVQIRTMQITQPPIKIICPGRVYRCDMDLTHTPMFHQVEGLWVDKDINFANLRHIVSDFLRTFFDKGNSFPVRFRTSYFPFTEPSAEVDIACVRCNGKGCRVCSHTGWLEVMGCGMVHPNVLEASGIDSGEWQGIAFGMGIERLAMLYYGIDDLRLFFENQPHFLGQFRGRTE